MRFVALTTADSATSNNTDAGTAVLVAATAAFDAMIDVARVIVDEFGDLLAEKLELDAPRPGFCGPPGDERVRDAGQVRRVPTLTATAQYPRPPPALVGSRRPDRTHWAAFPLTCDCQCTRDRPCCFARE